MSATTVAATIAKAATASRRLVSRTLPAMIAAKRRPACPAE
jgi:hypothetical protein